MRAKEFLLEYNRDVTSKQTSDKILTAVMNDNGFLTPSLEEVKKLLTDAQNKEEQLDIPAIKNLILANIEEKDTSSNKMYVPWLARVYSKGNVKFEDLNRNDILSRYTLAKKKNIVQPEHKDINKFKTYQEFEYTAYNVYDGFSALDDDEEEYGEKPQAKKVFEDDTVTVIIPENEAAACKYGRQTRWCTAATKGNNYFERYNKQGPLYILIPKNPQYQGEKYQLHFNTDSYMNEKDNSINLKKLLTQRFPSLDDFFKKFIDEKMVKTKNYIKYTNYGELHRTDGPALIYPDGREEWYQDGKKHRTDGPAVIYPDGTKGWYQYGKRHRTDGPAVIYPDGTKEWYQNDERHRTDGPAVIYPDGTKEWYQNGKRHRTDGPAIINPDGTKEWYQNGKRHRTDGPAVINPDGREEWYQDGKRHRTNGPAIIYHNGREEWYQNGKRHRTDGPAIIYPDGTEFWYQNGKLHRTDGSAVIYPDGTEFWYQNGKLHRTDGPAVIHPNGREEWYQDGKQISKKLKESTELNSIDKIIASKLNLKSFIVTEQGDTITLHSIIIGKENRGKGLGTKAMQMLTDYADQNQKKIVLTPGLKDKQNGTTSRSRLVKFYKQFGFVESKGKNIDYAIGAGKMYREPKLKENAWSKIRKMMIEGGWASTATQSTVITPAIVKVTLAKMSKFEKDFNNWLSQINLPSIKIGRPTGSTAYYDVDDEDKVYGDIDLQMIAPEIEEGQSPSQFSKFWNQLADQFIETNKPEYLHPTENTTGHPIVKVGKDQYVQVDFMWHPERLADWGAARVTPERGIKGLLTGNMFSVFGEIMNMSIQHAGVQLKLSNNDIVPFSKRKDTKLITITDKPKTYMLDTFKWLAARQGISSPVIDDKLAANPGVDINNVKISSLVQGVKGFAKSLELNDMFGHGDLSQFVNYEDFMKKFIDRYTEKAQADINGVKRDKAETPDAIARAEADRQKVRDGLALVLKMFEVE